MRRLVALVVVGMLALLAGTARSASGARPTPESAADRAAKDAKRLGVGSAVKIRLADGSTLKGVLVSVADDGVQVAVTDGPQRGQRHVAYADIDRIKKEGGSHAARWIALGLVLGILVPIGVCAAAA
jgi:hypothetical protein